MQSSRSGGRRSLGTLSYFDVAVLARLAHAPALFSVGLMDPVCPPSCCYAAFNAWGGAREVAGYAYNVHEGGSVWHTERVMQFFCDQLNNSSLSVRPS